MTSATPDLLPESTGGTDESAKRARKVYVLGSLLGQEDGVLLELASDGTVTWAKEFGSDRSDVPSSMSVDESGNVYLTGWTAGVLPGQVSPHNGAAFVVKPEP